MQVRNTTDRNAKPSAGSMMRDLVSVFLPMEGLMTVAHGVGIFMLVVGSVLGGGLASAQVYRNAAPGEMLYNVKLAVERAQLLLAPNEDYKTGLHAEFADRRIDEAAKLAEESAAHQERVPGVLAAFNSEVTALTAGLESMRATDPQGTVEAAKLMERKMAVYQSELRKASSTLPPQYQSSIAVSRDLVDGTTLLAIAVIVDSHLADASSVSTAVVNNKFEERIQQAENHLNASATTTSATSNAAKVATATRAKEAIAEAKQLVKDQDYRAALSKIEEVAQLTKEVEATDATETTPAPDGTNVNAPAPEQGSTSTNTPTTDTNTNTSTTTNTNTPTTETNTNTTTNTNTQVQP